MDADLELIDFLPDAPSDELVHEQSRCWDEEAERDEIFAAVSWSKSKAESIFVRDRKVFFRTAADYTEKKLVFDVSPRQYSLERLREELQAAGFDGFAVSPFLVPSRRALPLTARWLLAATERVRPLSRLLLAFRFSYVCAAFRVGFERLAPRRSS